MPLDDAGLIGRMQRHMDVLRDFLEKNTAYDEALAAEMADVRTCIDYVLWRRRMEVEKRLAFAMASHPKQWRALPNAMPDDVFRIVGSEAHW